MNVEAKRRGSSRESESDGSIDLNEASSITSDRKPGRISSYSDSESTTEASRSISNGEAKDAAGVIEDFKLRESRERSDSEAYSSQESIEDKTYPPDSGIVNTEGGQSDSRSSGKRHNDDATSSIASESDKGLLRSFLSDSSSEKIVSDIDIGSPKDGKFSSSTDDELLKKFREQQASRRFRPRSAKFRRDAEPEPEIVQKIQSRVSDKGSSKESSYSSQSSIQGETISNQRRRQARKPRKSSASSVCRTSSSIRDTKSSSSPSPTSSSHSSEDETTNKLPDKPSGVTLPGSAEVRQTKTTTASETSDSLTTNPTSPSLSTQQARPPSRQGRRPQTSFLRRQSPNIKSERKKTLRRQLFIKSRPLPADSRENWPEEPGFWWPYNEDTDERALERLIDYHKRRLNKLVAQEYLQKHLELELRKAGAQFKQYERGPRPISPIQVRKFKERGVTWVYLDGKLYHLDKDMGSWNTTQRGRQRNKVIPKKDKTEPKSRSSERSKRSVSFEKGADRRRSSGRSADANLLTKLAKRISPRKKKTPKRRRDSGSGSRKSSLSSKGSARSLSSNTGRTTQADYEGTKAKRAVVSGRASHSRSRSSSRASRSSSRQGKISKQKGKERPKAAQRPKTAKPSRARSISSTSKSSTERSSVKERKKNKHENDRRSSSTGSEKKSKKFQESTRTKNRHYNLNENVKLDRVLFTDDYEKRWERKKKEREASKPSSNDDKKRDTKNAYEDPPVIRKGDRLRSSPPRDNRPLDEYSFYRDPNIPGHAFPYYYLSNLLAMERRNKRRTVANDGLTRIVLKPAPVNKPPIWRTHSAKSRRKTVKSRQSPSASPKTRRKKKTKSIISDIQEDRSNRSSSHESRSSSQNSPATGGSHPRIRPGSGPIKCSWKAPTEPESFRYPGSDHQLKNTDNPAILAWLRMKDAQLRARRQNEMRKQRRKTAELIDEQNDLEDKHERALKQYELWKKNKDREILLRRRKEAKEANSVVFSAEINETKTLKAKERPQTAHKRQQKFQSGSTFSELRSSSASPNMDDRRKPQKQRPKSATTMGVSFGDHVDVPNQRPRSATPPRKVDDKKTPSRQNFFKSFLGVGDGHSKNKVLDSEQHDKATASKLIAEDRGSYDKWVRSGNGSNGGSSNAKGKRRKSPPLGRAKNKQRGRETRLPPHNHSDNDLISNLAKRRIETILESRKRVNTGLKKRPKSGENAVRKPATHQGSQTDPTHRKWKLREDNLIAVNPKKQTSSEKEKGSSSSSSSENSLDERPKFSFSRKSPSTSTRHHRNPVIREAISGQ